MLSSVLGLIRLGLILSILGVNSCFQCSALVALIKFGLVPFFQFSYNFFGFLWFLYSCFYFVKYSKNSCCFVSLD